MSLGFDPSPTIGDTHTVGGKTWKWNGTGWEPLVVPTFALTVSATEPSAPEEGDLWLDIS